MVTQKERSSVTFNVIFVWSIKPLLKGKLEFMEDKHFEIDVTVKQLNERGLVLFKREGCVVADVR